MTASPILEFVLALQTVLRWKFVEVDDETEAPGPIALALAHALLGLVLALAGTLLMLLVKSPWIAPAAAALCTALLRGYLTGWRQSALPLRLAGLLTPEADEENGVPLRLQVTATWLSAARPLLYFCLYTAGCQFWLMPALALGHLGAEDLRESLRGHAAPPQPWIPIVFLTVFAALFNRGSLTANLGVGLLVLILAWLLPGRMKAFELFRRSHSLNQFLLEGLVLCAFLLSLIF